MTRTRPPIIGLTGNIACGKSTVLGILNRLGALTIDADHLTHRALRKDGPAYADVVRAFGSGILGPNGEINRRELGKIVFADPARLALLESLVQPHVRSEIVRTLSKAAQPIVIDAIKLFEGGLAERCDEVWVVACAQEQQLERLMQRNGYSREESLLRIQAQPPQEEKVRRADVVIDNSGSLETTRRQVLQAWEAALGHESQAPQPHP